MVLTEPPPPEPSMMRMIGSRSSCAMRSARIGFIGMVASAEPPRTVKSSPEHDDRLAVDPGAPHHAVGGGESPQAAGGVVLGLAGDRADLVEAAPIEQAGRCARAP